MHAIEKKDYGFKLTFGDSIKKDEMTQWVNESKKALIGVKPDFGVFVDMRTLKPLAEDAQAEMLNGQKLYKGAGMVRSVVVLASKLLAMQFQRLAKESGIYAWERYLDATTPDWEKVGIAWITKAIDPDK